MPGYAGPRILHLSHGFSVLYQVFPCDKYEGVSYATSESGTRRANYNNYRSAPITARARATCTVGSRRMGGHKFHGSSFSSLYRSAGDWYCTLPRMLTTLRPMVRHHRNIIMWASSKRSGACSGIKDHDGPVKPAGLWIQQCSCAHVLCHVNELHLTLRIVSHGQSSRSDG